MNGNSCLCSKYIITIYTIVYIWLIAEIKHLQILYLQGLRALGVKLLSNTDLNKNQSNAFSFFLLKSDLVRSKSGHEFKLFPAKKSGLWLAGLGGN